MQATCEGYRPLTTQIFDRKDKYLDNDSVFAVKDSLVVDFVPRANDPEAALELNYDVKLVKDGANTNGV
jgi:catechol 1,2-dioxygenase